MARFGCGWRRGGGEGTRGVEGLFAWVGERVSALPGAFGGFGAVIRMFAWLGSVAFGWLRAAQGHEGMVRVGGIA